MVLQGISKDFNGKNEVFYLNFIYFCGVVLSVDNIDFHVHILMIMEHVKYTNVVQKKFSLKFITPNVR